MRRRPATPILLCALAAALAPALSGCGGSNALTRQDAAKLVSERFTRLEGVPVGSVSCSGFQATAHARAYLCQTGTLGGRPVDALVTRPAGSRATHAVPTLAVGRLEHLIESGDFARMARVPVLAASCPRGVAYRRGAVTICEVAFLGGEREPARVTQADAQGAVDVSSPNYIATKLELAIEGRLAAHRIRASVTCPQRVAISATATFACPLSDHRRSVRVLATDARGAVRFELPAR